MKLILCLIFVGFIGGAVGQSGFYPSDPSVPVNFSCLATENIHSYFTRIWVNLTQTNPWIQDQQQQAYDNNIIGYAIVRLCPWCIGDTDLQDVASEIRFLAAGFSIFLEITPEGWYANQTDNQEWVEELAFDFAQRFGALSGIITDAATWNQVFGPKYSSQDLPYFLIYYGDSAPNFLDYSTNGFGGQNQPFAKVTHANSSQCQIAGSDLYTPY
jgi:hypothetical protein